MLREKATLGRDRELETGELAVYEETLILGILWEGDLEIHTNRELMRQSRFRERVVHGDSVTAMVIASFLGEVLCGYVKENACLEVSELSCAYLGPVYVGDHLKGAFKLRRDESREKKRYLSFDYRVLKGHEKVSEGRLTVAVGSGEGEE